MRRLKEERKAITEAAEKRRQILGEISNGSGHVIRTFDNSERKTRTFAPDSEEYRSAWLKNLQGKPLDAEERAAITATAAIPTQTMDRIVSTMDLVPHDFCRGRHLHSRKRLLAR